MRKAQLTVFFILGAVLMLGLLVWWVVSLETVGEKRETAGQVNLQSEQRSAQLKQYFDNCVAQESYKGLVLLGRQGGYRDIPASFNANDLALWQFDNANTQPFLNTTLAELEEYLEVSLPNCMSQEAAQMQGFALERGTPEASVEFANEDVAVQVKYPLAVTQGEYKADYGEFSHTVKLPFRKIFEVATELNEHVLLPEFKPEVPLEGANGYGYALSYERLSPEMILFKVTDVDTVTPDAIPYQFQFLAKFGLTGLEKKTLLQDSSATTGALYTYEVRSPDNLAVLYVLEGTTISKDGNSVEEIVVDQGYPPHEFVGGLPGNLNGGSITYITTNPVYSFEPSGLLFNQPIPLVINYENNSGTREGVGMLQGEAGMWFPIRSFDNREGRYVTAYIQGFTNYTAVNCANQTVKTATKTDEEHPSPGCFVTLAIGVVTIGMSFYGQSLVADAVAGIAGVGADISAFQGTAFGEALVNFGGPFSPFVPPSALGGNILTAAGLGGVSSSWATALGYGLYGLSAYSLYNTFSGGGNGGQQAQEYLQNSPENCQNYIPTCDQTVTVSKEEDDGSGMCVPEGGAQVGAGQPSTVCAQVEQCNLLNRFFCMPCSVTCTVSFK
jgi:hypothetical protein